MSKLPHGGDGGTTRFREDNDRESKVEETVLELLYRCLLYDLD
jgi:hypothetical protein